MSVERSTPVTDSSLANYLPDLWGSAKLRWISRLYAGGTPSKDVPEYWEDGTIPWVNSGAVNSPRIMHPSAMISEAGFRSSSARWVPSGALVIALAGQGKTKGTVAQMGIDATCNQSMAAIVPTNRILSRFLFWWLSCQYRQIRGMASNEDRDGLNLEMIGSIHCPLPPVPVQQAIVAYLDSKVAAIDDLILEKTRMTKLLHERRTAVISQAVTGGVNGESPLKSLGLSWLSAIPEHWQMKRLKHCAAAALQYGANESGLDTDPTMPRFIRITDISADGSLKDEGFRSLRTDLAQPFLLQDNDFLLARSGATVGKTFRYRNEMGPACFAGYLIRMRPRVSQVSPDYLELFLNSEVYWAQIAMGTIKATIQNVNAEKYGNLLFPLPSLQEQNDIVSSVAQRLQPNRLAERSIRDQIKLLHKYRQALITGVVTGKIDVKARTSGAA